MKKARQRVAPPLLFDERLRYTPVETSKLLKQSRAKTFAQIAAGTLQSFLDGGRRYVPGSEIVRRSSLPAP